MNNSKLKREDFTKEVTSNGYWVLYKGEKVCGAGVIRSNHMNNYRPYTYKRADVKMYSDIAEIDINDIIAQGKNGRHYKAIVQTGINKIIV